MTFSVDLSRMIGKTKRNIDVKSRAFLMNLFTRPVDMSPVDTGFFRYNWRVAKGAPDLTVEHRNFEDLAGEQNKTNERIRTFVGGVEIDGTPLFLTNAVHYSHLLEYGSSKQAPHGMVRITIENLSIK